MCVCVCVGGGGGAQSRGAGNKMVVVEGEIKGTPFLRTPYVPCAVSRYTIGPTLSPLTEYMRIYTFECENILLGKHCIEIICLHYA